MKTTVKRELQVSLNYSKRTYTLKFKYSDGATIKYRTTPMSKEDFNNNLLNTENDWLQFLKTDDYYKVS